MRIIVVVKIVAVNRACAFESISQINDLYRRIRIHIIDRLIERGVVRRVHIIGKVVSVHRCLVRTYDKIKFLSVLLRPRIPIIH